MRVLSKEDFMELYYESDAYARYCSKNYHISIVDKITGDVVMRRYGGTLDEAKRKAKQLLKELDDSDLSARVFNDMDKVGVKID